MTQQTARGLAALGRGPDTELVHMAPGEVQSLQALAQKHGGSLTINPATGLPEAGFLSSILPMVIGAGLTAATGGAAAGFSPAIIAAMTGGGYGLATGSLKKGLMAGLGAYGGAGLGEGLARAGMESAATNELAKDAAYKTAQENMLSTADTFGKGAAGLTPEGFAAQARGITAPVVGMQETALANAQNAYANAGPMDQLKTMGSGISSLGSEAGRNAFMEGVGGNKGLMQAGLMAASPMLMQTTTQQPEMKTDKDMGQRYSYSPGATQPTPVPDVPGYGNQGRNFGKEQIYFRPQYTPVSNEQAKSIYGFANGGPVESMSINNSIGANTGYPQADIRAGAYATPYQDPLSRNVVSGAQDVAVDPYTGQEQRTAPAPPAQFADGGDVSGYTYDPATQTYVKAGGQGITSVKPAGFDSQQQGGVPSVMSPAQQAFFDNETPADRDARMAQVSNVLSMAIPGASMARGISDFANNMANTNAMTSMQAAQQADTVAAGGEGIGGSDISGQSEGTPALAHGGLSNLGGYSDGGRLLRGPGDGISDSIPATIGNKRPARLADGEFVVPARIVSELGNGSTEAGARKLYAMMERVQKARGKTVGKDKVATNSRAYKHLPA